MKQITSLFTIFLCITSAHAQVVTVSHHQIPVKALYLQCANEMIINVSNYAPEDVSFEAEGAELILGEKQGVITLVPHGAKAVLKLFYKDTLFATEAFPVRLLPRPEISLYINNNTFPHDLKREVSKEDLSKIRIYAKAPEHIENSMPQDAKYQITHIEVSLARGKELIGKTIISIHETINLEDLIALSQAGDRLIIEIKKIERMNYKGDWEEVSIGAYILTLSVK